ncbi:MAG: hypothetical protein R6X02_04840 [Enhygromyxa sp.]
MILIPQPHLLSAAVDTLELDFEWNDWDVHPYFRPGDAELRDRALGLSHRARIALTLAIGEWIVHRFSKLADVHYRLCCDYMEALWAWNIDWRYAIPFHPQDREWQGPVLGPLELVLVICNDAMERVEEQGESEHCPAWISQLAEHVLPDARPYRVWLDEVLARLEQHFAGEYDPDDFFLENDFRGPRVPREIFDVSRQFDPGQSDALLDGFLIRIQGTPNPFLRPVDELEDMGDEHGTPYRWQPGPSEEP